MNWCFAIVNNKIGEIYFDRSKSGRVSISNHCYVGKSEFKNKEERKALEEDIKKFKVIYKNKKYKLIK
jgi:hypothetical protein